MATKRIFTKSINEEDGSLTIKSEHHERTFSLESVPAALHAKLALHGLAQKIGDAAALPAGSSEAEKWDAMNATMTMLESGLWTIKREGAGTLLLRALCEVYPDKDRAALSEWLGKRTAAEKTALEANPKVRKVIDRLRKERAANSDVDADALLSELDEVGGE